MCCCVSGLWSLSLREQTASLRKSSINPATQDPAHLFVSMTTMSSVLETPGCRASVNNGEMDGCRQTQREYHASEKEFALKIKAGFEGFVSVF